MHCFVDTQVSDVSDKHDLEYRRVIADTLTTQYMTSGPFFQHKEHLRKIHP